MGKETHYKINWFLPVMFTKITSCWFWKKKYRSWKNKPYQYRFVVSLLFIRFFLSNDWLILMAYQSIWRLFNAESCVHCTFIFTFWGRFFFFLFLFFGCFLINGYQIYLSNTNNLHRLYVFIFWSITNDYMGSGRKPGEKMSKVYANGPEDRFSIPGRVISKNRTWCRLS